MQINPQRAALNTGRQEVSFSKERQQTHTTNTRVLTRGED